MKIGDINISKVTFPRNQYYQTLHTKKQIVFHHTVSPVGVSGDVAWWRQTASRIATCGIIAHDGTFYQCFSSKYWAHHLGVKQTVFKKYGLPAINTKLNQESIGVEIDSAGGLTKRNGKWYTAFGTIMPENRIQHYPNGYRGYFAYEKYTDAQIETFRKLLIYWKENSYKNIDYSYNDDIWDVTKRALRGQNGIFTHTSYRSDKSDSHPQSELINMLKTIK